MFEIFQYSFMIRALIAGTIAAILLPILGTFLVAKRYALIADSMAHVSLAGIAAGFLLHTEPVPVALVVAVVGAIALEYLRQKKQLTGDTSLALVMSGGLAIAIVLSNLSGGRADFNAYLFGSITTTSQQDIYYLFAALVAVVLCIGLFYQVWLYIAFDEDGAKIAGYRVWAYNYLLTIMTAIVVVLSLRIIGGLLIGALLVIPVVTASRYVNSFTRTMCLAIVVALAGVLGGLLLAFYADLAAGGAIVLVTLGIFILSLFKPNS
jgi:zinc transport system permease protein